MSSSINLSDQRFHRLKKWLAVQLNNEQFSIAAASTDASFRRYFRVDNGQGSLIAMDAPPAQENIAQFVKVAALMRTAGVHVPMIEADDLEAGFLLLTDFGSQSYLDVLSASSANHLYADALQVLQQLQRIPLSSLALPYYDAQLLDKELQLFNTWFIEGLLGVSPNQRHSKTIGECSSLLIDSALQQPQVVTHRDFHSRNLMYLAENNPGVIDFQDAVVGPITYDLASLLRDCYISWPQQDINQWLKLAYQQHLQSGLIDRSLPISEYQRWFDWMGMQRHLKAIGIFSRLKLRDAKPGYLADIPRTLSYVLQVSQQYPEFAGFNQFLQQQVLPAMQQHADFVNMEPIL